MSAPARRASVLLILALLTPPAAVRAADVATFDALLRLVRAEPDPAAVLEQCGDTVFTLSAAQRAQLAKAGAPATLIDALQKKRMVLDDVQNFGLIVDCSGSMKETLPDGRSKMDAAKAVLTELVGKIPDGLNVSLTLYGHDLAAKCRAVEVKRPLGPIDSAGRQALSKIIAGLEPVGHTPIAAALRASASTLSGAKGLSQVVLVTDGMETCHEDPAAVAEAVTLRQQLRRVEVVGLGIKGDEKSAVAKIARRGRGRFYDAQTAEQLAPALKAVVRNEAGPQPQEAEPTEMTPVLRALAEQLKDEDAVVRRDAAEALGKMGRKARPAAQALVDRVADDLWAESTLVEPFKQTAFDNQSRGSKDAALEALRKVSPDRVEEALLKASKSKTRGVKTWAIKRLGDLAK